MSSNPSERRLAAIMYTDVVGYAALMAESEERGLRARERLVRSIQGGKKMRASVLTCALTVGLAAVPLSGLAVDGVLEINQACAVNTGCFSGDAIGFPVEIDGGAGRSYRLTGDLVLPDEDTTGIYITTHDVGIDLNNFTIIAAACEGATTSACRTSGAGSGIEVDSRLERVGISVRNGSIVGMGAFGVYLGAQAQVEGVRARWNGYRAISVSYGSAVSGNTVYENGNDGIFALNGSTVSGNTVYANLGDGIHADDDCLVQRNTVRSNTGYGLDLDNRAAYRENVINANLAGTVSGGVNMGANSCDGATTCSPP